MKQELKTREQLEKSIKDKLPYYRGADLSAHTIEQLCKIDEKNHKSKIQRD